MVEKSVQSRGMPLPLADGPHQGRCRGFNFSFERRLRARQRQQTRDDASLVGEIVIVESGNQAGWMVV